jgi:hypothetical protein
MNQLARNRYLAPLLIGALALMAPPLCAAKNQPAPDWAVEAAKTPTPDNAMSAPAVVLYDEIVITVDEQNHAVERERSAVRILKPQGRKYAGCGAEFGADFKIKNFRSWTIAANGKQFQAMETDFIDVGEYDAPILQAAERIREVNPPAADPGAVVVCEIESQLRPYFTEETWRFQQSIPAVNQSLELDLPAGGHFTDVWHHYAAVKPVELGSNHLRWEVKDVPALDLENIHATPDWEALAARMTVQWGDAAKPSIESQWQAIGQHQGQLEEHRTDQTPEMTAKTQELIAGATDFYTKLSRITGYIQKNIRYFIIERGIGGWQPHYAADIYRNRYGDCKDKTTILIAMLQAAGITAHSFSVDHRRGFVDPNAPSLFGDHMITAIELPTGEKDPRLIARVKAANGKWYLIFDPTDEKTPVGLLDSDLQGGWGYLAAGADSQILQMPILPPDSSVLQRNGKFTLSGDGTLSGDVSENMIGEGASGWRLHIKRNDSKELHDGIERGISSEITGLTFKGYEFHQIDDLDKPLILDLHFSATNYAHAAGPLLLVRPRVLGSHAETVPEVMEGKPRKYPIEIGHPGRWHDSFDIELPAGYVVDEMPDPVNVDVDFASYHSTVTSKPGLLHYEREYVVRDVEIPPAKAADFRKLESAILFDEKGTAVLKKQ